MKERKHVISPEALGDFFMLEQMNRGFQLIDEALANARDEQAREEAGDVRQDD